VSLHDGEEILVRAFDGHADRDGICHVLPPWKIVRVSEESQLRSEGSSGGLGPSIPFRKEAFETVVQIPGGPNDVSGQNENLSLNAASMERPGEVFKMKVGRV